jgi:hypothetical protein
MQCGCRKALLGKTVRIQAVCRNSPPIDAKRQHAVETVRNTEIFIIAIPGVILPKLDS